jgi:hypothetical protein
MKKVYESKKNYSDRYNKSHKSIRITNELYDKLKSHIEDKNTTIKDFIELLIKKEVENK